MCLYSDLISSLTKISKHCIETSSVAVASDSLLTEEDESEQRILSQGVRNEGKLSQTLLGENTSAAVTSLAGDAARLHRFWLPVTARPFPRRVCSSHALGNATLDFISHALLLHSFCFTPEASGEINPAIFKCNLAACVTASPPHTHHHHHLITNPKPHNNSLPY